MKTQNEKAEAFAGLTRHGLAMHAQAGCGLVVSVAEHEFVVSALDARIAQIEAEARWLLAVVDQLKADAMNANRLGLAADCELLTNPSHIVADDCEIGG